MTSPDEKESCEEYQILMMGFIDEELDEHQAKKFKDHAYQCPQCAVELVQYQKLAELTNAIELKEPADYEWERMRSKISHQVDSRLGWFFSILGTLMIAGYLIYELCTEWIISAWLRVGIVTLLVGFSLMMLSAFRRRLRIKKYERYEAIKR